MAIYDTILNIRNENIEDKLKNAILKCQKDLNGLTKERMCKVYNSYLGQILNEEHVLYKLVNTLDLELDYEHIFLLVPNNLTDNGYFLVDLTFSQFSSSLIELALLEKNGYQFITNELFLKYLNIVTKNKDINITLDDVFYEIKKR